MDQNSSKKLLLSATPAGSSNKIRDIVRLRQLLKKWKKLAATNSAAANATSDTTTKTGTAKSINKFLKKTLSFTDVSAVGGSSSAADAAVPKGCLAVQCVEKSGEVKRFVIPTEYLAHDLFGVLLREAEEEFGFQQEGILKIPCEFAVFEKILKAVQQQDGKRPPAPAPPQQPIFQLHDLGELANTSSCYSPDSHTHHPAAGIPPQTQMCR